MPLSDESGDAISAVKAAREHLHAFALRRGSTDGLATVFESLNDAIEALGRTLTPNDDSGGPVEWRIVWTTGQETVGFTSRESAEAVLLHEQTLIRGTLQSRGPWQDVRTTIEADDDE